MPDSYFLNALILIDLGFEVLAMHKPVQNQDIDSKSEKHICCTTF